jgi:hypothetical protein
MLLGTYSFIKQKKVPCFSLFRHLRLTNKEKTFCFNSSQQVFALQEMFRMLQKLLRGNVRLKQRESFSDGADC